MTLVTFHLLYVSHAAVLLCPDANLSRRRLKRKKKEEGRIILRARSNFELSRTEASLDSK